jgi:RNA recognition motif-containing protein
MKKRKLFIGNLNYSVTADKLRSFLATYGTVIDVKVMEGKGYAFVEMGSEEQAKKIQTTLSESVFEGRKLLIDGVPGTRRSDNKSDKAQNFRENRPAPDSGRRTYSSPPGEDRRSPKPEWKNRNSPGESRSPIRPERSCLKEISEKHPLDLNRSQSTPASDKNISKKTVYTTPEVDPLKGSTI